MLNHFKQRSCCVIYGFVGIIKKKFFFDSYPGSSHKTFYNRSCDAYTNIIMKVMLYSYPIMEVMLNLCNYGGHAEPMQLWGTCWTYAIMGDMLNLCNYGGHAEPMQLWGGHAEPMQLWGACWTYAIMDGMLNLAIMRGILNLWACWTYATMN